MKMRSNSWAARVCEEYRQSARTWMVTFTLTPAEHALLDVSAHKLWEGSQAPSLDELLKLRVQVFAGMLRKWLKRVRSAAYERGQPVEGQVRYVTVAEVHDSARTSEWMRGRPHFHMILHEKEIGALVLDTECEWTQERDSTGQLRPVYRVVDDGMPRRLWAAEGGRTLGFTKMVLCHNEQSAYYLCKYLHKSPQYRILASLRYGKNQVALSDKARRGAEAKEAIAEGENVASPKGTTLNREY